MTKQNLIALVRRENRERRAENPESFARAYLSWTPPARGTTTSCQHLLRSKPLTHGPVEDISGPY